jgi:hypothetical protein
MKCETVQCPRSAQTRVDFQYPDGAQHSDHVCGRCARYYRMYSGTSVVGGATVTWTLAPPD